MVAGLSAVGGAVRSGVRSAGKLASGAAKQGLQQGLRQGLRGAKGAADATKEGTKKAADAAKQGGGNGSGPGKPKKPPRKGLLKKLTPQRKEQLRQGWRIARAVRIGRKHGDLERMRKLHRKQKRRQRAHLRFLRRVFLATFVGVVVLPISMMLMMASSQSPNAALMQAATIGPGPIPPQLMEQVVQLTGIPRVALEAYSSAAGGEWAVDWVLLAGIGKVECDHGRNTAPWCSKPYGVWRTDDTAHPGGNGERGPMQHLGKYWRRGITDTNQAHVEGKPEPHDDNLDYMATDGDGNGNADPWNWKDATHSTARKLTVYKPLLAKAGKDTLDFWIASYNGGPGVADGNPAQPHNYDEYVQPVKQEMDRIRAAIASLSIPATGGGYGLCPVAGKTSYSDGWGDTRVRPNGQIDGHKGVDMMAAKGTPVIAVKAGVVDYGHNNLGGNRYWLVADDGYAYYGAHLSAFGKVGRVAAGDVIGYVGNTGYYPGGTMPFHLHWEVHPGGRNGAAVNPAPYADQLCGRNGKNTQNPTPQAGAAVGGYALPVDPKFRRYDGRDDFAKPHHDYPAADLPMPPGTPVYAAAAGTVISAPTGGACGLGVEIKGTDGANYVYCHGKDGGKVVKEGDKVKVGQLIMHSGNTGNSEGPHLHFGIKVNGTRLCPQKFLVGLAEGKSVNPLTLPSSGCSY